MKDEKETYFTPTITNAQLMATKLSAKYNTSVKVTVASWKFTEDTGTKEDFIISLVPGFDEKCTQFTFNNWIGLLDKYFELMETNTDD